MVAGVNTSVIAPIEKTKESTEPGRVNGAPTEGKPVPESGKSKPIVDPIDLRENVERTIEQISQFVESNARGLRFRLDDASGRTVVTVVNPNNGEVIRQIPSEEFLQIASELRRLGEVHFVDKEA